MVHQYTPKSILVEQEMDTFGVITSCIIGKILACYNFHWFGVQGLESLDDEKNWRKKKPL